MALLPAGMAAKDSLGNCVLLGPGQSLDRFPFSPSPCSRTLSDTRTSLYFATLVLPRTSLAGG